MVKNETKLDIKDIKDFTKKVTSSKKEAEKFLKATGIYTKKGNLKKVYQ
jgi:hypothetical protein